MVAGLYALIQMGAKGRGRNGSVIRSSQPM